MARPTKPADTLLGIDRAKLRAKLRHLDRGGLLLMLERAMDLAADEDVATIVKDYIRPSDLVGPVDGRTVLDQVRALAKAALANEYYESFRVDSRNCTMHSRGTENFIADFDRLMKQTLEAASTVPPGITRETLELLFAPLRRIDEGMDDVLFFADEGGSWQVHVDWSTVLPVYFQSLANTAEPAEFAREVDRVIDDFADFDRLKLMAAARTLANAAQRGALKLLPMKPRR